MELKAALCRGKVLSTLQTKLLSPPRDAVETAVNRGAERRTHILGQPTPGPSEHGKRRRFEAVSHAALQTASTPTSGEVADTWVPIPDEVSADAVGKWIENSYTAYADGAEFLAGPTERTQRLNKHVAKLRKKAGDCGVLAVDPSLSSTITAFPEGYIDKELEAIVGLLTDRPLKRSIKPSSGIYAVRKSLESYGYTLGADLEHACTEARKTQGDASFDVHTQQMRAAWENGILTGLPDGYARGRIVGDYRRVAVYGVDRLIDSKREDLERMCGPMTESTIRLREEVHEQIRALKELKQMAFSYGYDISRPAMSARDAIQWTYFAYLAAVKEQDGAAMAFGRFDAFFDVYIQRDLEAGIITEEDAQELIDHLVMKLWLLRPVRTPERSDLFGGYATWVTTVLGGIDSCGNSMVTKTSFRILHALNNLDAAPELNIAILWDPRLPQPFKNYCGKISMDRSCVQYVSDALMRPLFGSDYGIAFSASGMRLGRDIQYFGAICNLPKLLLYSLNQGCDEMTGVQVGPRFPRPELDAEGALNYESAVASLEEAMNWLAALYTDTLNIIHFMHDKYNYECIMMALHDTGVRRLLAFGVAGLSVVTDSLSAIKYAKVFPIRDANGLAVDFRIEGDFPKFGNDNPRVDDIAQRVVRTFHSKLGRQKTYRCGIPTLSVSIMGSSVVYGEKTGTTPDGRRKGAGFAPGANAVDGRDVSGGVAALNSVASLPYASCLDGISTTFCVLPNALGKDNASRVSILAALLDGYFEKGGQHINVEVLNREKLRDAVDHPEKYPNLMIRISGYAVHFHKLEREQQLEAWETYIELYL